MTGQGGENFKADVKVKTVKCGKGPPSGQNHGKGLEYIDQEVARTLPGSHELEILEPQLFK